MKFLSYSNVSLTWWTRTSKKGWFFSEHLIRLTKVYDGFGTCTQATWYILVQLRRIGTGCLMCSWSESELLSCMRSWFDSGGLSLVCNWLDLDWMSHLMWSIYWLVQLDWTSWLYRLMSSVIQWTVISCWVMIRWWGVVSSGSGYAVWYKLWSILNVLFSRSIRSWWFFFQSSYKGGRTGKG